MLVRSETILLKQSLLDVIMVYDSSREPEWWDEACRHLSKDEFLGEKVAKFDDVKMTSNGRVFETIIRSIIGQQISVAAADSIWNRFTQLVGNVEPNEILKQSFESIAGCGITRAKTSYIIGLAENSVDLLDFDWSLESDIVMKHLVKFRGIGPWTAEMVMMFSLLKPDLFSIGDIALIRSCKELNPALETKDEVVEFAKRWSPYRTAACWFLWRMCDPEPVQY